MYIEQLKKYHPSLWLYLPLPLLFGILMVSNYVFSDGVDTNKAMLEMKNQIGVNGLFVALVIPLAIMFWGVLLYNKVIQNNSLRIFTTSRPSIDWKRIMTSFTIWGLFLIVTTLISYYTLPGDYVWNFKLDKFLVFLALAIVLIPMQTSFEEYLFRGHLMQGLGLATNTRWVPLLLTSFMFGIMHIANPEVEKLGLIIMFYYIGTGLFLGIITLMDEGMELALGFHAANNLIGALLVTSDWSAFQTHSILKETAEPDAGLQIFMPLVILFILILIFAKIYKWNNWKQRLLGNLNEIETKLKDEF
jgi:uncharacterized protein